jgi:hypothetical protein
MNRFNSRSACLCNPGKTGTVAAASPGPNAVECQSCEQDKFKDQAGPAPCDQCPDDTHTGSTGASTMPVTRSACASLAIICPFCLIYMDVRCAQVRARRSIVSTTCSTRRWAPLDGVYREHSSELTSGCCLLFTDYWNVSGYLDRHGRAVRSVHYVLAVSTSMSAPPGPSQIPPGQQELAVSRDRCWQITDRDRESVPMQWQAAVITDSDRMLSLLCAGFLQGGGQLHASCLSQAQPKTAGGWGRRQRRYRGSGDWSAHRLSAVGTRPERSAVRGARPAPQISQRSAIRRVSSYDFSVRWSALDRCEYITWSTQRI